MIARTLLCLPGAVGLFMTVAGLGERHEPQRIAIALLLIVSTPVLLWAWSRSAEAEN